MLFRHEGSKSNFVHVLLIAMNLFYTVLFAGACANGFCFNGGACFIVNEQLVCS